MKIFRRLSILLLAMLMILALPVFALAAGNIDLNRDHSLTVTAAYGEQPIPGMPLKAYLISTVDSAGELTVTENYRQYAQDLDIRGRDDERWQEMAGVLSREILLKAYPPTASAVTGETGAAVFGEIPMGLYLITGSTLEKDGYVYATSPFFVLVPEPEGDDWNYHVTARAKPGQEPLLKDYKVIKLWEDTCHRTQRPKSITIHLICDGEIYDTVTLPYNGAWRYTWKNLETNHQWTVTEDALDGYKDPDIQQEGNTFRVTNTCDKPGKPTQPGNPNLPQTGQLWWPVPVLIALGLLFTVIGLLRRRGESDEA